MCLYPSVSFAFVFAFVFSLALSFALRRAPIGFEKSTSNQSEDYQSLEGYSYVILPEGEIGHLEREQAWSLKGLVQATDWREERDHS